MINLDLNNINIQAPYKVSLSTKGDYMFETFHGIHYSISFIEDEPLGGCKTYQFVIERLENRHTGYDSGVEDTILIIIYEFFKQHLFVLLYFCDTSDGREAKRNRLFMSWFQKHADKTRFTICSANATVEGQGIYAAIIVENRNPLLDDIVSEFNSTASMLAEGK